MTAKDWKPSKMKHGYDHVWENRHEDEWEIAIKDNFVYTLEPEDSPSKLSTWHKHTFKTNKAALQFAKDYMRYQ